VAVTTGVVGAAVVRVGEGATVVAVGLGLAGDALGRGGAVVRPGLPADELPVAVVLPVAGVLLPLSDEGMTLPVATGSGSAAWLPPPPPPYGSAPATADSIPDDAATAPAAMAADEASSPVRTGLCLRRPRCPRWPSGPCLGAAGCV
jgi:hypothetical protein